MSMPNRARLLLTALVMACTLSAPRAPAGPPSIEGRITAVNRAGERIGSIRVEANPSDSSGSAKAVVTITQNTEIDQTKTTDFGVRLQGGIKTKLHGWFVDTAGNDLCGAFYATAHKV